MNHKILLENNEIPASNYNYNIPDTTQKYSLVSSQPILGLALSASILLTPNSESYANSIQTLRIFDAYQQDISYWKNSLNHNIQQKEQIFDSIDSFLSLNNNWDGYEAIPLGVESAKQARKFINLIPNKLFTHFYDGYPNTHGTISFEWRRDKDEFFIEIGFEQFTYYFLKNENLTHSGSNIPINKAAFENVIHYIEKLYG